jgi:hypothetical protein
MNPAIKSVLAALLAAACAVTGALYARRVLRENRAAASPAAPAQTQAPVAAPATPPAQ